MEVALSSTNGAPSPIGAAEQVGREACAHVLDFSHVKLLYAKLTSDRQTWMSAERAPNRIRWRV